MLYQGFCLLLDYSKEQSLIKISIIFFSVVYLLSFIPKFNYIFNNKCNSFNFSLIEFDKFSDDFKNFPHFKRERFSLLVTYSSSNMKKLQFVKYIFLDETKRL